MKARLLYVHTSGAEFADLPRSQQTLLRKTLARILRDPQHADRVADVIRLDGMPGYWRLKLGRRRVVYRFDGTNVEVWFIELRNEDTYERLAELTVPHSGPGVRGGDASVD